MNLNTLKGILIILVIMDHNEFSRSLFPGFLEGFGFHVLGFMTIPFLRPAGALNRDLLQYLFRLYHPFFVITTVMAVVVAVSAPVHPLVQVPLWALALYSGNWEVLKELTDMALLWFLPSFVAMVAIRAAIESRGKALLGTAIALLCVAHLFIGPVAPRIEQYLPLGLLPALYVIPLAYLGVWIQRTCYQRMPRGAALAIAGALFVAAKYAQMQLGQHSEIGFAEVAGYTDPYSMVLNDLEGVTGVLMLFQVCRFDLGRLVQACGRYSLQLYLFHPFVALAILMVLSRLARGADPALLFGVSMLATVLLSAAVGRFMGEQKTVKRFMFPRSTGELFGSRAPQPAEPRAAGKDAQRNRPT